MGTITSSVGLVSGLNTGAIINELISLDAQPITLLQNRVTTTNAQNQAYQALGTELQSLKVLGQTLSLPSTFKASTATSTDTGVLTATAGLGAAAGSYHMNVASLVTSQQAISSGYASPNSLVGAGTISISQGGGEASSQTTLAQLNGGAGVGRGQFRITDGSGNSSVIDISSSITLDDVVNQVNNALNVSVHASIKDNHLIIQDNSGQTKTAFSIADLGSGTAATDLGISGSTTTPTITGTDINSITANTPLSQLNDGRGIGQSGSSATDFQVNLANGSNLQISLNGSQTVGEVVAAINKTGGSNLVASIDPANNAIKLTDKTAGAGTFGVVAVSGSTAARDLGFLGTSAGGVLQGATLQATLDSVLTSSLNGGAGVPLGKISITDRTGAQADVDLSKATSVQKIIDAINGAGLQVTASLNNAGDGLQIQDTSGGVRDLTITDEDSSTAQALKIAGTYSSNQPIVNSGDLHTQYISENTPLSKINGGKGVPPGTFSITNSTGLSATVSLAAATLTTVGDVISAINAKQLGVTASINANGDGVLLTDTAGGAAKLTVSDKTGSAAASLNIAGVAAGTTIDGSFTKTVTTTASDTLATLQTKISALGFGVAANVVNDGSGNNGYHLSLTAFNSGLAGRVTIDGGATGLNTQNIVQAQDAAVFYGGSGSGQSLLVTSSSNQIAGIIAGVTLQLQGTGAATLNVARDPTAISTDLQTFTDTFNGLVDQITTLTQWDSTTNQGGLLLGDPTAEAIQSQMYQVFNSVVNGAGQFKLLSDVGLTLGDGAKIKYDSTKFQSAYATDPDAVNKLFSQASTGLGAVVINSMNQLIDPESGTVSLEEKTLTNQVSTFQTSITQLNAVLSSQRNTLENEFANMETVLAGLQSQQSALATLTGIKPITSSSSSSSSSSNSSSG